MEAAGDLGHKLLSHQMEDSGAQCNFDQRQPEAVGPGGGGLGASVTQELRHMEGC